MALEIWVNIVLGHHDNSPAKLIHNVKQKPFVD